MTAFLNRLMSNTSRHVAPQLDDLDPCAFDADDDLKTCPQCGRRASMDSHLCDMGSGGTSPVVGCAFVGGRSDELPEIRLAQAVQACHDISAKINAWACECEAQGARKCGGCE